jgi:hypothetical protein
MIRIGAREQMTTSWSPTAIRRNPRRRVSSSSRARPTLRSTSRAQRRTTPSVRAALAEKIWANQSSF